MRWESKGESPHSRNAKAQFRFQRGDRQRTDTHTHALIEAVEKFLSECALRYLRILNVLCAQITHKRGIK